MNELYDEINENHAEIEILKNVNQNLRNQVSCLVKECGKKNRRIDILRRKIKDLEDDNFELRNQ